METPNATNITNFVSRATNSSEITLSVGDISALDWIDNNDSDDDEFNLDDGKCENFRVGLERVEREAGDGDSGEEVVSESGTSEQHDTTDESQMKHSQFEDVAGKKQCLKSDHNAIIRQLDTNETSVLNKLTESHSESLCKCIQKVLTKTICENKTEIDIVAMRMENEINSGQINCETNKHPGRLIKLDDGARCVHKNATDFKQIEHVVQFPVVVTETETKNNKNQIEIDRIDEIRQVDETSNSHETQVGNNSVTFIETATLNHEDVSENFSELHLNYININGLSNYPEILTGTSLFPEKQLHLNSENDSKIPNKTMQNMNGSHTLTSNSSNIKIDNAEVQIDILELPESSELHDSHFDDLLEENKSNLHKNSSKITEIASETHQPYDSKIENPVLLDDSKLESLESSDRLERFDKFQKTLHLDTSKGESSENSTFQNINRNPKLDDTILNSPKPPETDDSYVPNHRKCSSNETRTNPCLESSKLIDKCKVFRQLSSYFDGLNNSNDQSNVMIRMLDDPIPKMSRLPELKNFESSGNSPNSTNLTISNFKYSKNVAKNTVKIEEINQATIDESTPDFKQNKHQIRRVLSQIVFDNVNNIFECFKNQFDWDKILDKSIFDDSKELDNSITPDLKSSFSMKELKEKIELDLNERTINSLVTYVESRLFQLLESSELTSTSHANATLCTLNVPSDVINKNKANVKFISLLKDKFRKVLLESLDKLCLFLCGNGDNAITAITEWNNVRGERIMSGSFENTNEIENGETEDLTTFESSVDCTSLIRDISEMTIATDSLPSESSSILDLDEFEQTERQIESEMDESRFVIDAPLEFRNDYNAETHEDARFMRDENNDTSPDISSMRATDDTYRNAEQINDNGCGSNVASINAKHDLKIRQYETSMEIHLKSEISRMGSVTTRDTSDTNSADIEHGIHKRALNINGSHSDHSDYSKHSNDSLNQSVKTNAKLLNGDSTFTSPQLIHKITNMLRLKREIINNEMTNGHVTGLINDLIKSNNDDVLIKSPIYKHEDNQSFIQVVQEGKHEPIVKTDAKDDSDLEILLKRSEKLMNKRMRNRTVAFGNDLNDEGNGRYVNSEENKGETKAIKQTDPPESDLRRLNASVEKNKQNGQENGQQSDGKNAMWAESHAQTSRSEVVDVSDTVPIVRIDNKRLTGNLMRADEDKDSDEDNICDGVFDSGEKDAREDAEEKVTSMTISRHVNSNQPDSGNNREIKSRGTTTNALERPNTTRVGIDVSNDQNKLLKCQRTGAPVESHALSRSNLNASATTTTATNNETTVKSAESLKSPIEVEQTTETKNAIKNNEAIKNLVTSNSAKLNLIETQAKCETSANGCAFFKVLATHNASESIDDYQLVCEQCGYSPDLTVADYHRVKSGLNQILREIETAESEIPGSAGQTVNDANRINNERGLEPVYCTKTGLTTPFKPTSTNRTSKSAEIQLVELQQNEKETVSERAQIHKSHDCGAGDNQSSKSERLNMVIVNELEMSEDARKTYLLHLNNTDPITIIRPENNHRNDASPTSNATETTDPTAISSFNHFTSTCSPECFGLPSTNTFCRIIRNRLNEMEIELDDVVTETINPFAALTDDELIASANEILHGSSLSSDSDSRKSSTSNDSNETDVNELIELSNYDNYEQRKIGQIDQISRCSMELKLKRHDDMSERDATTRKDNGVLIKINTPQIGQTNETKAVIRAEKELKGAKLERVNDDTELINISANVVSSCCEKHCCKNVDERISRVNHKLGNSASVETDVVETLANAQRYSATLAPPATSQRTLQASIDANSAESTNPAASHEVTVKVPTTSVASLSSNSDSSTTHVHYQQTSDSSETSASEKNTSNNEQTEIFRDCTNAGNTSDLSHTRSVPRSNDENSENGEIFESFNTTLGQKFTASTTNNYGWEFRNGRLIFKLVDEQNRDNDANKLSSRNLNKYPERRSRIKQLEDKLKQAGINDELETDKETNQGASVETNGAIKFNETRHDSTKLETRDLTNGIANGYNDPNRLDDVDYDNKVTCQSQTSVLTSSSISVRDECQCQLVDNSRTLVIDSTSCSVHSEHSDQNAQSAQCLSATDSSNSAQNGTINTCNGTITSPFTHSEFDVNKISQFRLTNNQTPLLTTNKFDITTLDCHDLAHLAYDDFINETSDDSVDETIEHYHINERDGALTGSESPMRGENRVQTTKQTIMGITDNNNESDENMTPKSGGVESRKRHNPDVDNLKSLLKKPANNKRGDKKNRVVFNEKRNEFFDADYIILIREECEYDEEDDEGVCTCSQHEMVRLTCCEPNCNCNSYGPESYTEPTPPSPKYAPPIEFVDAVTLSPPEGYKDMELEEHQQYLQYVSAQQRQQMLRAKNNAVPVCRDCSANNASVGPMAYDENSDSESLSETEGGETSCQGGNKHTKSCAGGAYNVHGCDMCASDGVELRPLAKQKGAEIIKTDQSQQTTPTTPTQAEHLSAKEQQQRYIVETVTLTSVNDRHVIQEGGEKSENKGTSVSTSTTNQLQSGRNSSHGHNRDPRSYQSKSQQNTNESQAKEDMQKHDRDNSSPSFDRKRTIATGCGSPISGILKGGKLWNKQQLANNGGSVEPQNAAIVSHQQQQQQHPQSPQGVSQSQQNQLNHQNTDSSDSGNEDSSNKRSVRFIDPENPTQSDDKDANNPCSISGCTNAPTETDNCNNSISPDGNVLTLTFKLGNHNMLISNNSLRPNSAVRQLFPCTNHLIKPEENASVESDDSQKVALLNEIEDNALLKKTIERNTLRRSLIRFEPRSKKVSQKSDNSLTERIKQLTCNIDDDVPSSESMDQSSGYSSEERSAPLGEESRKDTNEMNHVKNIDKPGLSPSSSSTNSSNSSMSSTYRKLTDLFAKKASNQEDGGNPTNGKVNNIPDNLDLGTGNVIKPDFLEQQIAMAKLNASTEARKQFLSTLAPLTACVSGGISQDDYYYQLSSQTGNRNSVASTIGTEYSLEDIEAVLKTEEDNSKRVAPDVLAGTPSGTNEAGDELANFVKQDAGRIERIKKRYQPETNNDEDDEHDDYGFNRRPSVRGIKPRFGSTNEIIQQIQSQIQPNPNQMLAHQTNTATTATSSAATGPNPGTSITASTSSQHPRPTSQISWPYYSETASLSNVENKRASMPARVGKDMETSSDYSYQIKPTVSAEALKYSNYTNLYYMPDMRGAPRNIQFPEPFYQTCMNPRCTQKHFIYPTAAPVRVAAAEVYHQSLPRRPSTRPESPPPRDVARHQTMVFIPYNHIERFSNDGSLTSIPSGVQYDYRAYNTVTRTKSTSSVQSHIIRQSPHPSAGNLDSSVPALLPHPIASSAAANPQYIKVGPKPVYRLPPYPSTPPIVPPVPGAQMVLPNREGHYATARGTQTNYYATMRYRHGNEWQGQQDATIYVNKTIRSTTSNINYTKIEPGDQGKATEGFYGTATGVAAALESAANSPTKIKLGHANERGVPEGAASVSPQDAFQPNMTGQGQANGNAKVTPYYAMNV